MAKLGPLRIGKNSTPPGWQKQDSSGLAKLGPSVWQNWDPSGLGKNRTLPDFDPFGFVKITCPVIKVYTIEGCTNPSRDETKVKRVHINEPKKYSYSEGRNLQGGSQAQRSSRYKLRDDMDKRRFCANCGSADHHVAHCTTYKQGMKNLGYAPEEEDMNHTEEREFYSEGHFRMDFPLFWEAVKNQNHPKHKLALAAVQNTRNRQAANDLSNKEAASGEFSTKTPKVVTRNKDATGAEKRNSLEINYERAAAEAINKVKQDMATNEIEQCLKQEIEKQRLNETLCMRKSEPETGENSTGKGNCNTLKMVT